MTRIEEFGWRGGDESGVARVVSAHGDYLHIVCNEAEGELLARKKKSAFRDAELFPITGDFVRFAYNPNGESMISEVLPRRSWFERKDPTAKRQAQTLAVNFDKLLIMMSLNANFSIARLERYLDLAESVGGAQVKVVLTKSDLASDGGRALAAEAEQAASGRAEVRTLSLVNGNGLDQVRAWAAPRQTLAFIGSSGVGKSSLLNALAGEEWAATGEIQEWSGKGRHTTTSRELVMLPNGAMVIDTPGIREIGRIGEFDRLQVKGESTHRYRK